MSANNWGICPRCKVTIELAHAELVTKAKASYGKVPPEEYSALVEMAGKPLDFPETFREDYSVGAYRDGFFRVYYGGACETCGLSFEFKHEVQIPGALEPIKKATR